MTEKSKEPCWYVVHTYSGYENKVKDTLEKAVENNGMQDLIFDVRVPVEDVVEIKNGKRVKSQRKVYPGYVLVHMIETSESWYVVRNTPGVTGFVGPDSKAVSLTEAEVEMMLNPKPKRGVRIANGEHVRFCPVLWRPQRRGEDENTSRGKHTVKVQIFLGRKCGGRRTWTGGKGRRSGRSPFSMPHEG
jgi:transcriptional antiterminator NusG